jgi:hypothetical protein
LPVYCVEALLSAILSRPQLVANIEITTKDNGAIEDALKPGWVGTENE